MNIENAKKIKFPEAGRIFEELEKARLYRRQERFVVQSSLDNPSSNEFFIPSAEVIKGNSQLISSANQPSQTEIQTSCFSLFLKKICCCVKAKVVPDATQSIHE